MIFTNLFPNARQPLRGTFVESLVEEIAKQARTTVLSPLPWFPRVPGLNAIGARYTTVRETSMVPSYERRNGVDVFYPKYLHIPVISRRFHHKTMALGVERLFTRVVRERNIDLINAHWAYPDGVFAVKMGKRLGVPVVVTAHGSDINFLSEHRYRVPHVERSLRQAAGVTVVSDALRDKLQQTLGLSGDRVRVIPNGVDRAKFQVPSDRMALRRQLDIDESKKYVLFVGHLDEVKGLFGLLDALELLRDRDALAFETFLIGEGSLEQPLRRRLADTGLDGRVTLLGPRPNSEIPVWLGACDVFCLPSKSEGLPVALLEALSCGTPAVASAVGGIPAVIHHDNGILVPPTNPEELAAALEAAVQRDWNSKQISDGVAGLTWQRSSDLYVGMFRDILGA